MKDTLAMQKLMNFPFFGFLEAIDPFMTPNMAKSAKKFRFFEKITI